MLVACCCSIRSYIQGKTLSVFTNANIGDGEVLGVPSSYSKVTRSQSLYITSMFVFLAVSSLPMLGATGSADGGKMFIHCIES